MLLNNLLNVPEGDVKFLCRAKYIPTAEGGLRLAMIQKMSHPCFSESGWELDKEAKPKRKLTISEALQENIIRAERRARIQAFDIIQCNPELNAFATFTYSPDKVNDRNAYEQCYDILKVWLSNRVQRNDLKYIVVPERHVKGGIHFHAVLNASAVNISPAVNSNTGHPIKHKGRWIYNLNDWKAGFSTLELIGSQDADRDAVSKYVFKYMSKQHGIIGGRYFLHGGALRKPLYVYGNTVDELIGAHVPTYRREISPAPGITYEELTFI